MSVRNKQQGDRSVPLSYLGQAPLTERIDMAAGKQIGQRTGSEIGQQHSAIHTMQAEGALTEPG